MKGLVLAAGRGSRLAPHTDDRPKALVEVRDRPLLDRQVAALQLADADEIGVVVGWKAGRFADLSFRPFVDHRWSTSTMVEALREAGVWLRRASCIVAYGDIVFDPDDARRLANSGADVAIAYDAGWLGAWAQRFEHPLDDAEVFLHRDGWLIEAGGRAEALDQADGQYIGLLRTTPVGWAALMDVADRAASCAVPVVDVTDLLTRAVRSGQPVAIVPITGTWWEVDHPTDLDLGQPRFDAIDRLLFGDRSLGGVGSEGRLA